MSARSWSQGLTRPLGESGRRPRDRPHRRSRSLAPAPEDLESRLLLAGSLPPGSPDPTLGRAGLVTTQFGGNDSGGVGALQPDGKIVVAGAVGLSGGTATIGLARYLPDGRLDTSFGPD